MVNPWGTQQVRVRRTSDNAILATSTSAEVSFATAANAVYVLERTAKPLSGYGSARLTGTANQSVKTLSGTSSALGIGQTGNSLVNDTELTYDANWYATSSRGYGDYNDDTHHSNTVGSVAQYTFTGTGIEYLSERNGDMGNVDVYLDNVFQSNVNLNVSGARQAQQVVFGKSGLSSGQHTIRIVNKSTAVGMVDALRILTQTSATPTISLRSKANNLYVSAAAGSPLIAGKATIGTGEQFERVDLGNGNVALRARINNQYVSAAGAGAQPLIAGAAAAGSWETFQLISNPGGTVSLRAQVNSRLVCAEGGGAQPLIANRDAIGPWEQFDLITN